MSLPLLPWCGVRADRRSPMRIDSGGIEPFDFASVGARQPTSRARVLEVRIQSPPAASRTNSQPPYRGHRGTPHSRRSRCRCRTFCVSRQGA
jgi:hypothetical protein